MDEATIRKHEESKQYPMVRDSRQVLRVHVYQYLWADTLGYLLHPAIPQDIRRVADVGTGTGIWLCELQKRTSALEQLDGFDISAESFIRSRDLPDRISLHLGDATGPVPESLKGKYDVVHMRLIQPGLQDGDPLPVISHCLDLLRPGGYLQWEEFDVTKINLHVEEDVPKPSNLGVVAGFPASAGKSAWVENLAQLLEAQGMEVKAVERRQVPSYHRMTMSLMICQVVNEITYAALDVHGPPGLGDKVRAQVAAASGEAMRGSYAGYTAQAVVARKPL